MAKRFTDTEIWNEDWFLSLESKVRLFWFYLKDVCDCAGIWRPNILVANRIYGFDIELQCAFHDLTQDKKRIIVLKNGRWFLPGFIPFQYGLVLNKNSAAHRGVLKSLELNEVDLSMVIPKIEVLEGSRDGLGRVNPTLKDKDKDKDKEFFKEEGGMGETKKAMTDVQKVVGVYRMASGFQKEDPIWDKAHFPRCAKSAKVLIDFLGNWKMAADCIQDVYEHLTSKGLTVTMETIVKHSADWKKDYLEREAKRGRVPVPSHGSSQTN